MTSWPMLSVQNHIGSWSEGLANHIGSWCEGLAGLISARAPTHTGQTSLAEPTASDLIRHVASLSNSARGLVSSGLVQYGKKTNLATMQFLAVPAVQSRCRHL